MRLSAAQESYRPRARWLAAEVERGLRRLRWSWADPVFTSCVTDVSASCAPPIEFASDVMEPDKTVMVLGRILQRLIGHGQRLLRGHRCFGHQLEGVFQRRVDGRARTPQAR